MSWFNKNPKSTEPNVIPFEGDITKVFKQSWEVIFPRYINDPEQRDRQLGKWQALIDYLVAGNEVYIIYKDYGAMKGSIGKLEFDWRTTDIRDIVMFSTYDIEFKPAFKITFEETRAVDHLTHSAGLNTERSRSGFDFSFEKPEHYYLTNSSFYKKNIMKSNIIYDRYGIQITEGCYVFASLPGKPPSIEAGKIVNVTDSGIIWFKKIGQDHIIKGLLRAQSCVVITDDLITNVLMEKLST